MDQGTTLTVAGPEGVLSNDTDADDEDQLTAIEIFSLPGLELSSDGSFIYTPDPTLSGDVTFTYIANDGAADSNAATVTITINSVGQMACSDYTAKGDCNNDVNCEWSGNPKNGTCNDVAVCTPAAEVCNDGIDNDCDGAVDCSDSDCIGDLACPQVNCGGFQDKTSCNAEATCRWDNRSKSCINN